jgi:hypothetical protein
MILIMLTVGLLALAGCDVGATPPAGAEYTVMLYAVGDKKFLDKTITRDFAALKLEGTSAYVRFTALVN